MGTAATPTKTCMVCGQDVSGKPRVKDAQGRYACQGACAQEAAARLRAGKPPAPAVKTVAVAPPAAAGTRPPAAKPPVAPPPPGVDPMLASLVASAPTANSVPCPKCASHMAPGQVMCMNCGFNTETGRAVRTAVTREKEAKAPKVKGGRYNKYAGYESGPPFWKLFAGFSVGLAVVGLLPVITPELFLVSLIILGIASLLAWVGGMMSAFRNDQTMWGVIGICHIVPIIGGFCGLAYIAYNALFNEDKYSRAMYWATWIGGLFLGVGLFIALMNGQTFDVLGTKIGGTP